jgi:hypothetical protein
MRSCFGEVCHRIAKVTSEDCVTFFTQRTLTEVHREKESRKTQIHEGRRGYHGCEEHSGGPNLVVIRKLLIKLGCM